MLYAKVTRHSLMLRSIDVALVFSCCAFRMNQYNHLKGVEPVVTRVGHEGIIRIDGSVLFLLNVCSAFISQISPEASFNGVSEYSNCAER